MLQRSRVVASRPGGSLGASMDGKTRRLRRYGYPAQTLHAAMQHPNGDNYSDTPKPLGGGGARIACGVIPAASETAKAVK
jgi:Cu/Zn superoxide dismutase